jgi:hypothetical protein
MTQADSVLSTPQINAPTSRRRFLSAAATVAASSAAAALAIPPALGTDPIFDAIERHKLARAAVSAAAHQHDYHKDKHTYDAVESAFDAETEAACALINIQATTRSGLGCVFAVCDRGRHRWHGLARPIAVR